MRRCDDCRRRPLRSISKCRDQNPLRDTHDCWISLAFTGSETNVLGSFHSLTDGTKIAGYTSSRYHPAPRTRPNGNSGSCEPSWRLRIGWTSLPRQRLIGRCVTTSRVTLFVSWSRVFVQLFTSATLSQELLFFVCFFGQLMQELVVIAFVREKYLFVITQCPITKGTPPRHCK